MRVPFRSMVVIAGAASVASVALAAKVPAYVAAALAAPARADQQGDDNRRHAAEVIAFSGVKPGANVVDYAPGVGYWTRIFAGVVGLEGRVQALWPQWSAKYVGDALTGLQARGLANVTATQETGNGIEVPAGSVDLVWTVQNYHDIPQAEIGTFNASVFTALKRGGTFVVIDHADAPFKGAASVNTLHRIDPILVRNQVVAAGFRLVGESPVLRNKADDHTLKVFDPAIRGRTDQFVLKFRKP